MHENTTEGLKQTKKLLIVITPFMGRGGVTRILELWTRYLRGEFEMRILCWSYGGLAEAMKGSGAVVVEARTLGRAGRCSIIPAVLSVFREIRQYRPDVIISMYLWSDFLTSLAVTLCRFVGGRLQKKPLHIVHLAGNPMPPEHTFSLPGAVQKRIYSAIVKTSLRHADGIICVSSRDRDMIISDYGLSGKKVQVIAIGVELSRFRPRRDWHDPFTFGILSRLSPEKNLEAIIRAVKGVLKSARNLRLEIFGEGPEKERLENVAQTMGLRDNVAFNGYIPEISDAYAAMDCLLMFSDAEGTPFTILEAAERGVPVIARDVGGIGEMVRHGINGYLVNTEEELEGCMTRLVDFPHQSIEFGNEARHFIEANYTIQNSIDNLKAFLKSVA